MKFECDACGRITEHDPARGHVPPGWAFRRVGPRVWTFCESCGHPAHFAGGLSPELAAALEQRHGPDVVREG